MENVLNRRMFQQPIHAKSGVYVPTIEDILQFYQGEFNANGEPIDQEALMRAADIATIARAAANKDNSQFLLDDEMAEKYKALGANIIPDGRGAQMFGTDVQAGDTQSDGGWNIEDLPLNELLQQEEAKVLGGSDGIFKNNENLFIDGVTVDEGPDLKIHDFDNMPAHIQEQVEAMDKSENDYAQEQLFMDKLNNQRQLELMGANNPATVARDLEKEINYQKLQKERENREEFAKVRNLAGDREQDVSEDAQVEMIKRNIVQGTNIIEPGTEEFKNLSAVNRMKVKDAITKKRKEELDLTDVSETGMQNIIEAAGGSAEVAIEIWNDMKNFGGEVAEGADEMLTGWKDAIGAGLSEEQKKELSDQLDFLKTKNQDSSDNKGASFNPFFPTTSSIAGWVLNKSGILSKKATDEQPPKQKENWGESGPRDKELDLANRADPTGLDTRIFKEDEGGENVAESVVSELNKRMDQLLDARDKNLIDEDTFKKEMNIINDQKNKLQKIANEGKEGRSLWADVFGEKWDPENDPYIQYFDKKIDEAFNNGGDLNEDGTINPGELFKFHLQKKKSTGGKPPKQKENWGESETRDKELDLANRVDPTVSVEDVEKIITKAEGDGEAEVGVEEEITTDTNTNTGLPIDITGGKGESLPVGDPDIAADLDAALAGADTATVTNDTVGLNAVNGAVPAGTSAMAKLIAETAKETGYNFGAMNQTKDDLALKTILYGLKLATTPGKFSDAVLATGFDAVKNEINERYRTKASKQKFAGTLFNTMLAGKLDLEKARITAANKKTIQKKYDFGKNFQASTLARIQTGDVKKGLGFDLSGLGLDEEMNEDNEGAKMFVLDIMDEMQMLANRKVTGGDEVNPDELFNQAVENLSPVYKIVTKDLFSIMYTLDKELLGDWFPGDWKQPKETTIERLRTDTKTGLTSTVSTVSKEEREKILEKFKDFPVTEAIVKQQMKEHNKTRDEVIAEFEKVGADISGV